VINESLEFFMFKIVSLCKFGVLYVVVDPCNVSDSTVERAYLADRPILGYRGVKELISKQSMQYG
jgi:hypothetical protein